MRVTASKQREGIHNAVDVTQITPAMARSHGRFGRPRALRTITLDRTLMLGRTLILANTPPELLTATAKRTSRGDGASSSVEAAMERARTTTLTWRQRAFVRDDAEREMGHVTREPWLVAIPDIGPACEVLLADRVFHDLRSEERVGLSAWIRGLQDESGAWLDAKRRPDLSLTVLAYWARLLAGDDPNCDSMVRAVRATQQLGGAQRANFGVRLWLAMAGQISWRWLPAIPAELWLAPESTPLSPQRMSPWARGMLTPYLLLARAPVRFHLPDVSVLLLRRSDGSPVAPRLTRPGFAGDLLQAFDEAIKLARKVPRGPLLPAALRRARAWLISAQQDHGGWFSIRPTLLALLALRTWGAASDDPRVLRGLAYLRRARGYVRPRFGTSETSMVLGQGLTTVPLGTLAALAATEPYDEHLLEYVLAQALVVPGSWQKRADAPVGGFPSEAGARDLLDVDATCDVLEAFARIPAQARVSRASWPHARRAVDVLWAMQETDGSFSRFERGESDPPLRKLPWQDADLLAIGKIDDHARIQRTARVLRRLADLGVRADDDRINRGLYWLEQRVCQYPSQLETEVVAALTECVAALLPPEHVLRRVAETRLRGQQREDGSFGTMLDTAAALSALLDVDSTDVQSRRAAHWLARAVLSDGDGPGGREQSGFGLSPTCIDPTAGIRMAYFALSKLRAKNATGDRLDAK